MSQLPKLWENEPPVFTTRQEVDEFWRSMEDKGYVHIQDPQAKKLYSASKFLLDTGESKSIEELQTFASSVQKSEWMKEHYRRYYDAPLTKVLEGYDTMQVLFGLPMAQTEQLTNEIEIAPVGEGKQRIVVLHEIVHALMRFHWGIWPKLKGCLEPHGPEFARIKLELVEEFMDKATADRLRQSFRQHFVDFQSEKWKECG